MITQSDLFLLGHPV